MKIDVRRALEALVPNAKWDFSIPNEGGIEEEYNEIYWRDERRKPTWEELVVVSEGFAAYDLLVIRQGMEVGALQIRRALREMGLYTLVVGWVSLQDEEVQEAWEHATTFKRLDPFIVEAISALEKTEEEGDALFALASTK